METYDEIKANKSDEFIDYELLKDCQITEFTADFIAWKEKFKFSLISAGFFAFCTLFIAINSLFSIYFALVPAILMIVFLFIAINRYGYFKMHKNNIRMIHSIHRQFNEIIENIENSDEYKAELLEKNKIMNRD